MPVLQTLDVSTAHITNSDMDLIGYFSDPLIDRDFPLRVSPHAYGWVLFLPDAENRPSTTRLVDVGLSPAFCTVIDRAYARGCAFVNFDRDGETEPGLAVVS